MKKILISLFAGVFLLLICSNIDAQRYSVTFQILDADGERLRDAVVTLSGVTQEPGEHIFDNVQAGTQTYSVEKEGYTSISYVDIEVDDNIEEVVTMREIPPDRYYSTDREPDLLDLRQRKPQELAYVREADVLWAKRVWQQVDLREKINQTLYFPIEPTEGRRSLAQILYDAILEGEITAFPYEYDDFSHSYTPSQVRQRLEDEYEETISAEEARLRGWGEIEGTDTTFTVTERFRPDEVTKLRIKEDWFFDSKRSVLDVRILGISLVSEQYDEHEGVYRDEPLFWVYYPEVRDVLANEEVYTRHSDAQKISFDDLFLRRMFNGYIIKEANVYDRSIAEYASGLDALLEAEEIKNKIREFEHDLWEY